MHAQAYAHTQSNASLDMLCPATPPAKVARGISRLHIITLGAMQLLADDARSAIACGKSVIQQVWHANKPQISHSPWIGHQQYVRIRGS
eukprot:1157409-Pelagomonas_calceolata.AAC.15